MREIKFRAWSDDGEHKGMLPVESITFEPGKVFVASTLGRGKVVSRVIERDTHKTILMQFTGLFDCNDVEIYEGDIVKELKRHWCNSNPEFHSGFGIVEYLGDVGMPEFCASNDEKIKASPRCSFIGTVPLDDCEVIGNIYENKDLIDSK